MKKMVYVYEKIAFFSMLLFSSAINAAEKQQENKKIESADEPVVIVISPVTSPLNVVTSLKTPRQPVPASDGSDYLKTIPGFSQIRNGGTNGDPVFRGLFGSRLRLLTNDGEMLGACPSRMDAPTSYISPENYDTLTLIKGPETVLWGPGNSAGTLRFNRNRPRFMDSGVQGNASFLTASNERWDGNADVSLGSQQGYLRLIGNKSRSGDYEDGDGKRVPSKWSKWNSDVALGWTPDDTTLLELNAGYGDGEARYAGRGMDGAQFKRESLGLRFEKNNIGRHFDRFEASVYRNYADHIMDNYTLRPPMQGHHSGMKMLMKSQVDRLTMGGRAMGRWLWSDYELKAGADVQTNRHRKQNDGWKKDAHFQDVGLFSELTKTLNTQNKVIGGIRADRVQVDNYTGRGLKERSDTLPAGFARWEHKLQTTPVIFYAGLGYTERFPDYWELFSPTYGPNGNPNPFDVLNTEKTTQLDIGAQYDDGKNLTGWISAYAGHVKDFILFRYDSNNPRLSQADNVDADIMGSEMGGSYKLTDTLKADVSLAYSWAKNKDDQRPLPQIPPLEARLGLSWEEGNWSGAGLLRLVNKQDRVAINEGNVVGKDFDSSAGFTVFSANAAYKLNKNIKVSSGVDNLFNTTYSEHLNLAGNGAFGYSARTSVTEPGRTIWLKMNLIF